MLSRTRIDSTDVNKVGKAGSTESTPLSGAGRGRTQGVQSGAAADGARDRAGDKARTQVQGPPRARGWTGGKAILRAQLRQGLKAWG